MKSVGTVARYISLKYQEAGFFVQADNKTMEGRVIKKAKRRGIKNVRNNFENLKKV